MNTWLYLALPLLSVSLFYSFLFIAFSPIPLIYGYLRFGRFKGTLMVLFSLLLANLIKSHTLFLLYALTLVPLTFSVCELSRKKYAIHHIFLKSIFILLICYGGALFLFSKGMPYAFLHEHISSFLKSLPQWIAQNDGSFAYLGHWKEKLETIAADANILSVHFIQEQLFGYLIGFFLLMLWLTTIGLKILGTPIVSQDLTQWKTPDHLVWLFIVAFFLNEVTLPILTPVGKNIFHILWVVYFLQGISIATFYFLYKQYSLPQKILSYLLLTLFPFLTTCFGFFDLWIDFRLHISKQNKKPVLKT